MRTEELKAIRLVDYTAPAYRIPEISLDVVFATPRTRVIADMVIERAATTAPGAPLVLDGDELSLNAVRINGNALASDAYEVSPQKLIIKAPPQSRFTLEIETLLDPDANTKLSGLYRSSGVYCTQCEAEGFRRITYFLDRPDILSVYTVRLEADQKTAPVLLANGNPVERGVAHGGRHFAIWYDPHPKPSYLFAMVAGDLVAVRDKFTTMGHHQVDLAIYVEHGKAHLAAYAMDALKRSMRWDEQAFGCEYDLAVFNIVAVSDFNMGAMENKGLNIFNDKYILADPQTATDADYARIETVVAHEYFHNWTGNRITCRDWFQLCLKEGLTVYRDQEFSAHERDAAVERIANVRTLKALQFPEDAGPLAHPVRPEVYREINNFYTATVYEKGAEIVRMIATLLGPEQFRRGMAHYFHHFDGTAATVEDFVGSFEAACHRDLSNFYDWYRQAGTPSLVVEERYDAAARTLTITFSQHTPRTPGQSVKKPVPVPIRFGLLSEDGEELGFDAVRGIKANGDVMLLEDDRQVATLTGVASRPILSLLRGFTAPVKLSQTLSTADRLVLLRADPDLFNRWQACQDLGFNLISGLMGDADDQQDDRRAYVDALVACALDARLPSAFRALTLALPTESDIARQIGNDIDPQAIYEARQELVSQIANRAASDFTELYLATASDGAYTSDAAAAGERALRLALLGYIAVTGSDGAGRARDHFSGANNMTDRIGALTILVNNALAGADEALDRFAAMNAGNPLALDKWLSVQAMNPREGTLETVKSLTGHETFSYGTPNRVRALIGAFSTANPTQFNQVDGSGYRFVADVVGRIDAANPQLAARLLTAFRSWRALEPVRREIAGAVLNGLAAGGGLSRDTADILDRMLSDG